ncbi:NADH-quinone oxidoreductase subunit A [Kibdelosporangium persicum]|uniref:NADH-quinone oxidoreductase subunit n=1 Tax=Kibdelosporangium persicum TaxID=2698649 RepID=A0ABX2FCS2_9PSEU|nr:NADH-quinone oxidoreductase subunit A [Kibdelosporangium persicum]NRN69161.1 NADH-quinone oxidoreductase subunit A [Kibdelosporangium persicum]
MNVVAVLVVLGAVVVLAATAYAVAWLVRLAPAVTDRMPFLSGHAPAEHAVSRYHVRWYTLTMIFLAFDMEMVFMYPWTLVVSEVGTPAVVEMFLFLAVLFVGVWYARREGALRWS